MIRKLKNQRNIFVLRRKNQKKILTSTKERVEDIFGFYGREI